MLHLQYILFMLVKTKNIQKYEITTLIWFFFIAVYELHKIYS